LCGKRISASSRDYTPYATDEGGILMLAVPVVLVNIAALPPFFAFPSGYGGWKLPTYLALFTQPT